MSMMSPFFVRLIAVVAMNLCLAGCGRAESYRYKLTMAVNTPDGVKRASSVVEVTFWAVSIPASGVMHKLNGQAVYLDLGAGTKPLIALLTSQLHPKYGSDVRWSRDAGPEDNLLSQLYGPVLPDLLDDVARLAGMRGSHKITPNDLPDLVTFADVNDPATVIEVDRNDLQATLGAGVSWNEVTLECTDEPISTGIVKKLPWLSAYYNTMLDGARYKDKNTLANTLSTADLHRASNLKESN
jgi:hypothetical protein